jgi:hypothetical protein
MKLKGWEITLNDLLQLTHHEVNWYLGPHHYELGMFYGPI